MKNYNFNDLSQGRKLLEYFEFEKSESKDRIIQ